MREAKSGGFQKMGLHAALLKGVLACNYMFPTPIQRRVIPIALQGKDVVVMARTGSGKTAAFLIPMFQRLEKHSNEGIRALIVLPTRDLALQTVKFVKNIGRYLDLTCALIVGGEAVEEQFFAIHQNPDIIIATPGRFLHVLTEMSLKLSKVEYLVFDETDRLYEMGFGEDVKDITKLIPSSRQTLLISATLPKNMIKFSAFGLESPEFVRLDLDTNLSDKLKLFHFYVKADDKLSLLLYLLQNIVKKDEQTLVFVPTRYHVDMIQHVLQSMEIKCSVAYSKMDEEDRQINVSRFRNKSTSVLICTDIASRGIDIPLLDNVVNYNFPSTAKLFIHRSGRVARANRDGCTFSFVSSQETPYLFELYSFLGKEVHVPPSHQPGEEEQQVLTDCGVESITQYQNHTFGNVPQSVFESQSHLFGLWDDENFRHMLSSITNAEKKLKTFAIEPQPEFIRMAKSLDVNIMPFHPIFKTTPMDYSIRKLHLYSLPKMIRKKTGTNLDRVLDAKEQLGLIIKLDSKPKKKLIKLSSTKKRIALSEYANNATSKKFKDSFYLSSRPLHDEMEKGLEVTDFTKSVSRSCFEIVNNDDVIENGGRNANSNRPPPKIWDRKRKKYVRQDPDESLTKRKIRTESGVIVKSSYSTDHYKRWLKHSGVSNILSSAATKDPNTIASKIKQVAEQLHSHDTKSLHHLKKSGGSGGVIKSKKELIKKQLNRDKFTHKAKRKSRTRKSRRRS